MWRKMKLFSGTGRCKLSYASICILVAGVTFYAYQFGVWENDDGNELETTMLDPEDDITAATSSSEDGPPKMILYWTILFGAEDFRVGFGKTPFESCPISNCETTNNRSLLNLSDALIFNARDTHLNDLPAFRLPHQRWVSLNQEPPVLRFTPRLIHHRNLYNWSMTYRTDSDVHHPYFRVLPVKLGKPFPPNLRNLSPFWTSDFEQFRRTKTTQDYTSADIRFDYDSFIRSKTKSVAWVVSNCRSSSKREIYVHELAKYIDVDIYGKCGVNPLPCNSGKHSCFETIGKEYKFYLAFENAICADYVTEKVFNALSKGVVPIVFGIDAHKQMAPPHSFIDARKFESPQALAEFLRMLMNNEVLYKEYLLWNNDYYVDDSASGWCNLCQALHDPEIVRKKTTYVDIHDWWFNKTLCIKTSFKTLTGNSIV